MAQPSKQTPNANGLYPAEEKFLHCLKSGEPCQSGEGWLDNVPHISPRPEAQVISDNPNVSNVIRGDTISRFLVGKGAIPSARGLVELCGYWIEGFVDFYFESIPVGLIFRNCHFDSDVNLAFTETRSIAFPGSRLCEGIMLNSAVIRGNLNMNPSDGKIDGAAFVSDKDVLLMGARIHGDLNCSGGQFKAHNKAALHADRAKIDGDVMANKNFFADGDVRFPGARIGGAFNCIDAKIIAQDEAALILADARIGRSVMLVNSHFENQLSKGKGCAIAADGLHIDGSLILRESHTIGEARFSLVKTGGDLDFSGGKFDGTRGCALSARGANVGCNVLISDKMSANGMVDISGAEIKLDLNFADANIQVDAGGALLSDVAAILAENVNVGNAMVWRQMSGNGIVNLASSSVGTLSDDIDAWNDFTLILDNLSYDRLVGADVTSDSRCRWLSKQKNFSPQPYEQAATVLFKMGHAHDAREILLEKEQRQTMDERTPPFRKFWREWWDLFAGYGYRLHYTVIWMGLFCCRWRSVFPDCRLVWQHCPHSPGSGAQRGLQEANCAQRQFFPRRKRWYLNIRRSILLCFPWMFSRRPPCFIRKIHGGRALEGKFGGYRYYLSLLFYG